MSRKLFSAGFLLAAMVALTTQPVHAQKKAAPAKVDPIDSGKLQAGDFIGTLKTTPDSDRTFTLEIEQDQLVPVGAGKAGKVHVRQPKAPNMAKVQQCQQRIIQAQNMIASAKTAQENKKGQTQLNKAQNDYQNAVNQVLMQSNAQTNAALLASIRQAGAGLPKGYKVVKSKTAVEFQATDVVKVRTIILPEDFDEKGNPKKYTKAELADLKGKDKNLVGYESALEKLQTGQKLRVRLVPAPKKAKKPADKDVEKEADPTKKMLVKIIVILEETKTTETTPTTKKKK